MTDEAFSFAFGWNGFGQVGTTGTRQQVNEPEIELDGYIEAADDYEMAQRAEKTAAAECSPYAMVDTQRGRFTLLPSTAATTWGNGRDGQLDTR